MASELAEHDQASILDPNGSVWLASLQESDDFHPRGEGEKPIHFLHGVVGGGCRK